MTSTIPLIDAAEFFVALRDTVDVDPPETPSFTPVGASNKMCWLSCLQSAAAELALSSFLPTPLAHLKGMITGAFRAASLALGKQGCQGKGPHVALEPVAWLLFLGF